MTLEKKIFLCVLLPFISSCTFVTVEGPDLLTGADSIVEIEFVESAPKDRFIITNAGACVLEELMVELDLSQSAGMLIFDTSAEGAGVEVFQPFEVEEGNIVQLATDSVNDGDTELALRNTDLSPGDMASFAIDVDDTLPKGELGQIRVTDSEISGATVGVTVGDSEMKLAEFDNGSLASVKLPVCPPAQ